MMSLPSTPSFRAPPLLAARRAYGRLNSFSLVEVIIAMAVVSFSLTLIVGMLALGLSNSHDSSDRLQAANVASVILNARLAQPVDPTSTGGVDNLQNLALPAIFKKVNGTNAVVPSSSSYPSSLYVRANGTSNNITPAEYNTNTVYHLYYNITTNAVPGVANVDLILWWPASGPKTYPTNNPSGYYEITTQVAAPSS